MAELGQVMDEAYAAHVILWNLGFEPSQIDCFVSPTIIEQNAPPVLSCVVVLKAQELTFTMPVGEVLERQQAEEFTVVWPDYCQRASAQRWRDSRVLDHRVERTQIWRRKTDVLWAMARKGFRFPRAQAN